MEESAKRNPICLNSLTLNAYGCAVNHIVPLEENIHFLNEQEEISHFRRPKVFQFSHSPLWDYQHMSGDHRFLVHKSKRQWSVSECRGAAHFGSWTKLEDLIILKMSCSILQRVNLDLTREQVSSYES